MVVGAVAASAELLALTSQLIKPPVDTQTDRKCRVSRTRADAGADDYIPVAGARKTADERIFHEL